MCFPVFFDKLLFLFLLFSHLKICKILFLRWFSLLFSLFLFLLLFVFLSYFFVLWLTKLNFFNKKVVQKICCFCIKKSKILNKKAGRQATKFFYKYKLKFFYFIKLFLFFSFSYFANNLIYLHSRKNTHTKFFGLSSFFSFFLSYHFTVLHINQIYFNFPF